MTERKDGDSPFLERWSQRKLEPGEGEAQTGPASAQSAEVTDGGVEARQHELEGNRKAAEAIDLESLDAESDYSPFLKAGVPKALKSAALRVLWRSDPVFANLDGLNDYDENFADPALIKKFAGSAWQVGKGYLRGEDAETDSPDTGSDGAAPATARSDEPPAESEVAAAGETGESEPPADRTAKPDPREPGGHGGGEEQTAGNSDTGDTGSRSVEREIVADPADTIEKVPLRTRLSLDDWDV